MRWFLNSFDDGCFTAIKIKDATVTFVITVKDKITVSYKFLRLDTETSRFSRKVVNIKRDFNSILEAKMFCQEKIKSLNKKGTK